MGARESEHKAVVRRFIGQAFNAGDLAIIDELMTSDYVLHGVPEVRGPEGMKHFVTMYRRAFPDYACSVEDQIAEGDKVVTRWTARGTQQGELMGIPPTGKQVILPGVVVDRIVNGRLVETWLQVDVLGMLQQLGVVDAPAGAAAQAR
jgi:steroid delta-isomerase-like uncharacterized protein